MLQPPSLATIPNSHRLHHQLPTTTSTTIVTSDHPHQPPPSPPTTTIIGDHPYHHTNHQQSPPKNANTKISQKIWTPPQCLNQKQQQNRGTTTRMGAKTEKWKEKTQRIKSNPKSKPKATKPNQGNSCKIHNKLEQNSSKNETQRNSIPMKFEQNGVFIMVVVIS